MAASSQILENAAPVVTTLPFSVGLWCKLTAVGTVIRTLFSFSDTGTTNNYIALQMDSTEFIRVVANENGTLSNAATNNVLTAGTWVHATARVLATDNRRVTSINGAGLFAVNSSSATRAISGLDTMTIGALRTSGGISLPWNGLIAEFWIADGDIYPDSAANMPESYVRQLAYGGPFSIPFCASKIVEYRSFRTHPTAGCSDECYHRMSPAPTVWTNTNGVTMAPHCPLPYWYKNRIYETPSMVMV